MDNQPYHLTPEELLFLLGLLDLQPLPETILSDWLTAINIDLLAEQDDLTPAKSLLEKGWIWHADSSWHMDDGLAQSLELIAQATTDAIFHLQAEGSVTSFSYAQYRDRCCRYTLTKDGFSLEPPQAVQDVTKSLLPEDIQPTGKLQFRDELDLPSLFVLIEAGWQTARAGFLEQEDLSFTMEDLISGLDHSLVKPAAQSWLGLELEVDLEKLSLHTVIQDLINQDLLMHLPGGRLRLASKSDPFNLIISDPNLLGLSCSFHNQHTGEVRMASWLFGSGELLKIEAVGEGQYQVNTLFATQIAQEWIENAWSSFSKVEPPSRLPESSSDSPKSRKLGSLSTSKQRPSGFFRFVKGLAATLLSALVIGLLSSTILGLIQGELTVDQLASQMSSGLSALAEDIGFSLSKSGRTNSNQVSQDQDSQGTGLDQDAVSSGESNTSSSEAELQAALAEVSVQEKELAQDGYEDWYALAILQNNSELPLSRLEVEVQIQDSSGEVLYSETGWTRTSLAPGEQTVLDLYLYGWEGGGTDFQLEIIPVKAGLLPDNKTSAIELEDLQILSTGYDNSYVTVLGEMVNPTQDLVTVEVGSLLRSGTGQLAVGRHSSALQSALLPGERVPFSIRFNPPQPIENLSLEENLELFVVGVTARESVREPDIQLSREQQVYVDTSGGFHIAGQVLNGEDGPRRIQLIGAVYDQQGVLVDACSQMVVPRGVPSGSVAYYDLFCWFVLEDLDENPDLRERAFTYDIMVDRLMGIEETDRTAIPLEINDLTVESSDGYVHFSGSLGSAIPEDANDVIVVLNVHDVNSGSLVAVYYAYPDWDTLMFIDGNSLPESIPELTPDYEVSAEAFAY